MSFFTRVQKFNPNHSPADGRFTSGKGGGNAVIPEGRKPGSAATGGVSVPKVNRNAEFLSGVQGISGSDLDFNDPAVKAKWLGDVWGTERGKRIQASIAHDRMLRESRVRVKEMYAEQRRNRGK